MARYRSQRKRKNKPKADTQVQRVTQLARTRVGGAVRLKLRAQPLEVIRGYDGPFRGNPEPAVIAAVYHCADDRATLVTRALFYFDTHEDAPTWAKPQKRRQPQGVKVRVANAEKLIVMCVAIEKDGGGDIQSLYSATANYDDLVAWVIEGSDAVPQPLAGVVDWTPPDTAVQVGLHASGGAPIDTFRSDDYVGTGLLWTRAVGTQPSDLLFPIRSQDARNDWVVHLRLSTR